MDNLISYNFITLRTNITLDNPITTNVKVIEGYNYFVCDAGGTKKIHSPRFQGYSQDNFVQVLFMGGEAIYEEEKNLIIVGVKNKISNR